MHPPRWGQVAWSPSGLHPSSAIGVQVCHAGVPHLVDRPTQLICISDLYMSTDKYKRHSRFATQVNLTSVLPRPQALLSLTTTSVTSLNIRPRGSLKDLSKDRWNLWLSILSYISKLAKTPKTEKSPEMFLQAEGAVPFPAPAASVHHRPPDCLRAIF